MPLYLRILMGCLVGLAIGLMLRQWDRWLGPEAADTSSPAALPGASSPGSAAARGPSPPNQMPPQAADRPPASGSAPGPPPLASAPAAAARSATPLHDRSEGWLAWLGPKSLATALIVPSRIILRLLGALAAPLVLLAVVQALMQAEIPAGNGARLVWLLFLNTLVAILIGLSVANLIQPGRRTHLALRPDKPVEALRTNPIEQILENIPRSVLGPFTDQGKITSVILMALAVGIAVRRLPPPRLALMAELVGTSFELLIVLLHWVIELIPLAVLGIVAHIVATQGFGTFVGLGMFVVSVLVGLGLHLGWYLTRIAWFSWVRPWDVLRGMRDALVMAFSTASSTATMPVTYACLREKVGLREQSASLGALVGANFNNDGTALYQAMAALFVAQLTGHELSVVDQLLVVLTAIAASVGAAGIPEAGIVTMTLIFNAVGLDTSYIPLLLTVDWFLDRCRTTINVMGDVNVSCLLDGRTPHPHVPTLQDQELAELA
jgi:DAACS family dicarboxylate/amino acid:cation (Na+ or H+) symporter